MPVLTCITALDGSRLILGDDNLAPNGQLGRNVVIVVCGDGVNPFDNRTYSMRPLAVKCYNLAGHHDSACAGVVLYHPSPWRQKRRAQ